MGIKNELRSTTRIVRKVITCPDIQPVKSNSENDPWYLEQHEIKVFLLKQRLVLPDEIFPSRNRRLRIGRCGVRPSGEVSELLL